MLIFVFGVVVTGARIGVILFVEQELFPFELLPLAGETCSFLLLARWAGSFLVEVAARTRGVEVLSPLPFFFGDEGAEAFGAVAGVHCFDGGLL
jgi:hypothetical protein